ncbi:MAG: hypothetical protein WA740_15070 [Candidatus Binataceae bacterium]
MAVSLAGCGGSSSANAGTSSDGLLPRRWLATGDHKKAQENC